MTSCCEEGGGASVYGRRDGSCEATDVARIWCRRGQSKLGACWSTAALSRQLAERPMCVGSVIGAILLPFLVLLFFSRVLWHVYIEYITYLVICRMFVVRTVKYPAYLSVLCCVVPCLVFCCLLICFFRMSGLEGERACLFSHEGVFRDAQLMLCTHGI